jgi:carbon-monoxide dehydrogenase medium subunit
VSVQSAARKREIPIEEFFVGAFETALGADEVVTEVRVPVPGPDAAATYIKFGYLERPSVGVALSLTLDAERATVLNARVAVGSAGPQPKHVAEAGAILGGAGVRDATDRLEQAGDIAARAADAVSDLHGPADYKEHLIRVLLRRAFNQLVNAPQSNPQ